MGYLVLGRRTLERIQIGDNIEILISKIKKDKVELAIKAPGMDIIRKPSHVEEQKIGLKSRD